jgi:phosphoserine phosphatase
VRHGATEWNRRRIAQGHADVPLNDEGRRQAARLAERLAPEGVTAVYSSDLARALDTARPLAALKDLDVVADPAFREIDQGEWEGLGNDEIAARWPELWGPARHFKARPGGESPAEVRARALEGLRRLVAAHPQGCVVVVSHGGTIRWLLAEALGLDDAGSASLRGVANGGIVSLTARLADGRVRLTDLRRLDDEAPDREDPNH